MDAELRLFRKTLKKNGYSNTRARFRLFLALQEHDSPTVKQLVHLLRAQDRATVYRNIIVFEKTGIINKLWLGWETKIELSDIFRHHHHHFTCVRCGKVIALEDDGELEQRITALGHSKRFKALDHQLEIRGLCSACQKSAQSVR